VDRNNILLILEELQAVNIKSFAKNIQFSCLLANYRDGHTRGSDHAGSMGISINPLGPSKVHCFSCKYRGSLVKFLKVLGECRGENYTSLIRKVGKIEELDPEQIAASVGGYLESEQIEQGEHVFGECMFRLFSIEKKTHSYALDRGFSLETMKAWDCRYSEEKKRIVFPVRSRREGKTGCGTSTLVGAVGRTVLSNGKPPYFNFFSFPKGLYLFGEHMLPYSNTAVIVEGLFDTVAVWQELGKRNLLSKYTPLGLLGSSISAAQAKKLVKWSKEVVSFVDNDPAGWTCQLELANKLGRSVLVRGVRYPKNSGTDPAALMLDGIDVVSLIEDADLLL